jgi:hypothetical protein
MAEQEEKFESYKLGVNWIEFGDQREGLLDALLESAVHLTAAQKSQVFSLWKRHPIRQQGKRVSARCYSCTGWS